MSDIKTGEKTLKELKLIAEKKPELGKRLDYEAVWATAWEQCQKIIAEGETDLSRLVLRVRNQYRFNNSDPNLAKKYRKDEENRKKTGYIFDRKLVRFDSMSTRFQPTMLEPLKLIPIIESCGEDIERIIELGSGWGRNIFKVWLNGGARNAEYWALDITETGAKIANAVAQASGKINLITHNFDFNFPDFSFLGDTNKKTVIFTNCSIEQITEIHSTLFEKILAIPGFYRCFHFEPVGFQIPGDSWLYTPKNEEVMKEIDENCSTYAKSKGLNQNLYSTLVAFEKKGLIDIRTVRKHYYSGRLKNAITLIVWDNAAIDRKLRPLDFMMEERDDRSLKGEPRSRLLNFQKFRVAIGRYFNS